MLATSARCESASVCLLFVMLRACNASGVASALQQTPGRAEVSCFPGWWLLLASCVERWPLRRSPTSRLTSTPRRSASSGPRAAIAGGPAKTSCAMAPTSSTTWATSACGWASSCASSSALEAMCCEHRLCRASRAGDTVVCCAHVMWTPPFAVLPDLVAQESGFSGARKSAGWVQCYCRGCYA